MFRTTPLLLLCLAVSAAASHFKTEYQLPAGYDLEVIQEKNPVFHLLKKQQRSEQSLRQEPAPSSTPAPASTNTTSPSPTSSLSPAPSTGAPPPPSSTPAPGPIGPYQISDIDDRNFTYVNHTSFDSGMNGWDFQGLWFKSDLSGVDSPPVPLPVATDGAKGEEEEEDGEGGEIDGEKPDDNNWVFISYASKVPGSLYRNFSQLSDGAVFFTFYVMEPSVNFSVSLMNKDGEVTSLYQNSGNESDTKKWFTQAVNFTREDTLSDVFTVRFTASGPPPEDDSSRLVWVALQHVAVGGAMLPPQPTTTPAPFVFPPGSLNEIQKISRSIWIALYVFLFFFLLTIAAVIFLVVRGRCR